MSCSRSFIDILFILLIGTIVMLSRSIPLGSVDVTPAAVAKDSVEPVDEADLRVVIVQTDHLLLDDVPANTAGDLITRLELGDRLLLVSGRSDLRHQRMMSAWSELSRLGWNTQIGVEPGALALGVTRSSNSSEKGR